MAAGVLTSGVSGGTGPIHYRPGLACMAAGAYFKDVTTPDSAPSERLFRVINVSEGEGSELTGL